MAVFCSDYQILFIGNPRTGSTAAERALRGQLGGRFLPEQRYRVGKEMISKKHSTLEQLVRQGLLGVDPAGLCKFVAVRNPFDSIASLYLKYRFRENRVQSKVQREGMSFREFVMWKFREAPPQSMHERFVAGMDEVIRFEALQEGLSGVLAKAGAPDVRIPLVNKTEEKKRHYSDYYDKETREIIGRVFAGDLERFGYSFAEA